MRRAAKTDGCQSRAVDYLRSIGWSVYVASHIGGGFPDLVVSRERYTALVELKDGSKPPSKRRLTEDQVRFHADWQGDIVTALSGEDAAQQLLALWRGWK